MTHLGYRNVGNIARIEIDGPGSVNVIGSEFLTELRAAADRAVAENVSGAILTSAKPRSFIDGADLVAIAKKPSAMDLKHMTLRLHETLRALATAPFPVVAVLTGQSALGGGFEALLWGCDHIFATKGTKLGMPEVNVGLFPAAGGPDALRRIVGVEKMVDFVMVGRTVAAETFAGSCLVTMVQPEEALGHAEKFIADNPGLINRNHDPDHDEPERLEKADFDALVAKVRKRYTVCPEKPWLRELVDYIEEGYDLPFEEAVAKAPARFAPLIVDPNTRNKIDLFFTVSGVGPRLVRTDKKKARKVETLPVLGAGLMGQGIAQVSADAGLDVLLYDVDIDRASAARESIGKSLERLVDKGKWSAQRRQALLNRITPTTDYAKLAGLDLVIETVFEDLELKRKILASVQEVEPDIVFASNSSTLPMDEIAAQSPRPENIVGMHYFSPVALMPLMEVVRGPRTSAEAVATAVATGKTQKKTLIVVGDGPGFYTSRIFGVFVLTGFTLAEMGMDPWQIDRLGLEAGFPQGPLNVYGSAGGAVVYHAACAMAQRMPETIVIPRSLKNVFEAGYTGAGKPCFYDRGKPDRSVLEHIAVDSSRETPTPEMAREMLLLSMVAQAFACMDEQVLTDYFSMDLGAILGVGFPDCWHGPARYVSLKGVKATRDRLAELHETTGLPFFRPAKEFDRLIACGVDRGLI